MFNRDSARKALYNPGAWASNGPVKNRIVTRCYGVRIFECEDLDSKKVIHTPVMNEALDFLEFGKFPKTRNLYGF